MATRRRRKRAPRKPTPKSKGPIERRYVRAIMRRVVHPIRQIARKKLLPELPKILRQEVRLDAAELRLDVDQIALDRVIEGLRIEFGRAVPLDEVEGIARDILERTEGQQGQQLELLLGEEAARVRREVLGLDPLGSEPWLVDLLGKATQDNVGLIQSIPEQYLSDIEAQVLERSRAGVRVEALALELENDYMAQAAAWVKSTENRAKLIAVDQVGKLYGELDRIRQTELGVERYRWRTSKDERVRGNPSGKYPHSRPSHHDREGVVFSWAEPPSESSDDGHPGQPIRCRCYAEPVLSERR